MKQKRKVKTLINSRDHRTINGNDVIISLLLVLGGALLLGSVSLFTTRGVDAVVVKSATKLYTGVTSKTETVYNANFYDQEDKNTVGDMYVEKGSNGGSDFYITADSVVTVGTNDGKIITEYDKVGQYTSSSILGGKVGTHLQSANVTVIGGYIRHVFEGNNNAALLGGDGIEIEAGSSGVPLVVVGGSNNTINSNQDGNSLVGGSNNNIGSSNINVHVLGGDHNVVAGNNRNVIVAGKYVQVNEDIDNVFAFSSKSATFIPQTSNAFYLDVESGLGLNGETYDGKVSSNGAVSMGELSSDDLNACKYELDQYVSEAVGVQGTIQGCAVGCTARSATDGVWELLDKSEKCVKVCEDIYDCTLYPEDETKGRGDRDLAYCTGIDIRDSWWDDRISQCGGDGAEQKYEDVVFKTEIIDREDKCPGEKTPKGENQCVFRCNPGYHLIDGKCYKDCAYPWGGGYIRHGESLDGYDTTSTTCSDECRDHKKTMTCDDGKLEGSDKYRYPENQCQTYVNTSCYNSHTFTSKIANADCSDSCVYYQEVSNKICIRPQTRYNCTCNEHYTMTNGECVPDTQGATCNENSLPENADVVINTFTQTWNGSAWSPASKDYDANNVGECTFECKENFTQNGNSCIASSNVGTCNANSLPANADPIIDTFAQTWNGSEWTPATKDYAGSNTTECTFGCRTNYTKDGDECKPGGNVGTCNVNSLPSNATGVINTFAQTWDGSAWTPATKNYAWGNTTECVFACNESYVWDVDQSKCINGHTSTCNASSLPSNATGVIKTFAQTWNGSEWTPATKNYAWNNTTECTFKCIDGYYWNGSSCSKVCNESHSACNGGYKTGGTNKGTTYTCTSGSTVVTCSCPTGEMWSTKVGACSVGGNARCGTDGTKYKCDEGDVIKTGYSNNVYTWKCENVFGDTVPCSLSGGNLCPSSTACNSLGTCPGGGFATGMSYGEPPCEGKRCVVSFGPDGNVWTTDYNTNTSQWKCVNGTYVETCSVSCPECKGTAPSTSAHTVANNSNSPSGNTDWHYSTNTSEACSYRCENGYDRVYNDYTNKDECKDVDHKEWVFYRNGYEQSSYVYDVTDLVEEEHPDIIGVYFDSKGGTSYSYSSRTRNGSSTRWYPWADLSYKVGMDHSFSCNTRKWDVSSILDTSFYSQSSVTYGTRVTVDLGKISTIIPHLYSIGGSFDANRPVNCNNKTLTLKVTSDGYDWTYKADNYSVGDSVTLYPHFIIPNVEPTIDGFMGVYDHAAKLYDWSFNDANTLYGVVEAKYYKRCDNTAHGGSKYQNGCQYRCNNGNWVKSDSSCGSSNNNNNNNNGQSCFLAGTQVYMADGTTKNIEDIEVGDMVLSYNTITKENEYNVVTKKYVHENIDEELYELTINGKILKVTFAHRFYVVKGNDNGYQCPKVDEWVAADHLKVGDVLVMIDGRHVTVDGVVHHPYHGNTYNLQVENVHNYYVDEGYLVHNSQAHIETVNKMDTNDPYAVNSNF